MSNLDSDAGRQSTSSSKVDPNFPSTSISSTPASSSSQINDDTTSGTVRRRDHNEPKKQVGKKQVAQECRLNVGMCFFSKCRLVQ